MPTWDRDGLLDRLGGDTDLALELGQLFLKGLPGQIAALDSALATRDSEAVDRAAHALKGASSSVGAEACRATAVLIRGLAAEGRLAEVQPLVDGLRVQSEAFRAALGRATGGAAIP